VAHTVAALLRQGKPVELQRQRRRRARSTHTQSIPVSAGGRRRVSCRMSCAVGVCCGRMSCAVGVCCGSVLWERAVGVCCGSVRERAVGVCCGSVLWECGCGSASRAMPPMHAASRGRGWRTDLDHPFARAPLQVLRGEGGAGGAIPSLCKGARERGSAGARECGRGSVEGAGGCGDGPDWCAATAGDGGSTGGRTGGMLSRLERGTRVRGDGAAATAGVRVTEQLSRLE
jgi:hypothetical protein